MLLGKSLFSERFVSSQIRDDWRVFYAQMTSCAVRYDVIYYPLPVNSQYLDTSEVDSPVWDLCLVCLEEMEVHLHRD